MNNFLLIYILFRTIYRKRIPLATPIDVKILQRLIISYPSRNTFLYYINRSWLFCSNLAIFWSSAISLNMLIGFSFDKIFSRSDTWYLLALALPIRICFYSYFLRLSLFSQANHFKMPSFLVSKSIFSKYWHYLSWIELRVKSPDLWNNSNEFKIVLMNNSITVCFEIKAM